ncbi:hypothetical protein C366_04624 [Cryptococcus neoformans Tu401-1]|nr:hypothetical protein C365_04337 [Cryptococcus neoformans var. grubii Bt85]OXG14582.1 hypothetical protein C366_04624 [Cryptococcus neoformans var. grubii Tu401-1]OXM77669.1 hypothetical protein C364_04608 [Cryptococcus neoformans var. grubii Bt63]
MSASPKSIDNSKSINLFPDKLCKTAQDDDELIWLGDSTFHRPPMAFNPSPLQLSVTLFDRLAYGSPPRSTGRSSPRNQWDSATDILFYHRRPSGHSQSGDTSECDSTATWTQSYTATLHQAKIETLGRKGRAGLLRMQTVQGSQNMMELLPYTPTTPAMKHSSESSIVKNGDSQEVKRSNLLISVLNSRPTCGDFQESNNDIGLLANRFVITEPLHLKECHSLEADEDSANGSYSGQPSGGSNKLQVDENVTETGERDSMKALVERTGRAAKRARMANI